VVEGAAGALAAAAVPFKALATFWKAVKFLSLVSTALMALSCEFRYQSRYRTDQDYSQHHSRTTMTDRVGLAAL